MPCDGNVYWCLRGSMITGVCYWTWVLVQALMQPISACHRVLLWGRNSMEWVLMHVTLSIWWKEEPHICSSITWMDWPVGPQLWIHPYIDMQTKSLHEDLTLFHLQCQMSNLRSILICQYSFNLGLPFVHIQRRAYVSPSQLCGCPYGVGVSVEVRMHMCLCVCVYFFKKPFQNVLENIFEWLPLLYNVSRNITHKSDKPPRTAVTSSPVQKYLEYLCLQ